MKKAIFFGLLMSIVLSCTHDKLPYINPLVGTDANLLGNQSRFGAGTEVFGMTLPAVLEPNGMNFWTAQTRDSEKKGVAPYYYCDSLIQGFRNSHWIVGGCTQDYGSMTIFPATTVDKVLPAERAVRFSHGKEKSTPYYYSVHLESGIHAEMTGCSRSAIFRFTYPEDSPAYLIINPNSDEGQGFIEIDTLHREIRGYNPIHRIYQGWGEPTGHSGHFVIRFSNPILDFGTWCDSTIVSGGTEIGNKCNIGLYVSLDHSGPSPVIIRVGSSFTDMDGAVRNLETEIPEPDFDAVSRRLEGIWKKHLDRITVTTANDSLLRKFYGSLYRASFLPRTISDVDGRYPAFSHSNKILQSDIIQYDDFSMWDTYRALHPLIALIYPSKSGEMMQSLVDKYEQGGWLPIFPCWNSYTSAMIGDHCIAALGDAMVKGISNFDWIKAYEGMRKNAFETPASYVDYAAGMGRRALQSYLTYGYIPLDDPVKEAFHSNEQSSRTLEYSYDDFVLSQAAGVLGRDEDRKKLSTRSRNYRNVIDPASGYVNGRFADGSFLPENNIGSYASFVTEGAPCHYTWYVPHDPYGLMELMGGRESYISRLDSLFNNNLYWHGNEPCHQIAYMYNYASQPWKTQRFVRHILNTEYGDYPGGLAGNDDSGQMSSWLIFSSLGFYPVCPGSPYYIIGAPQFKESVLKLENGKKFIIKTRMTGSDNVYIQSATLNRKPYEKNFICHEDIINGGVMEFVMGDVPNQDWGKECPPALIQEID